jgi:hypothetical protein
MSRPVDLEFGAEEKLWRGIEVAQVSKDRVRPNALRLQVSVVREKHGSRDSVHHDKFNGVAEITASEAVTLSEGALQLVCVDDPQEDLPGHSLIAFVAAPGSSVPEDTKHALRGKLARSLRIVELPTKMTTPSNENQ